MSYKSNLQSTVTGADAFFTICSKNFLAHARVLHNSVRPHYPSARFFVVLCDRVDGFFEPAQEPFEFVYLEELELPNLNDMAERYNITEFNTAVKPFAFSHLMDKHGFNSVIYLDPDLLLVDKMQELDTMLFEGAEAVLTPHILQPAEYDEVHDGKMLLFGIYNLGFLALRNTPSVRTFLSWWGRRLERHCIIQLDQGLFVDQKWADLLPAFVPGARVLHHPGYNVAYWNLPQRKITRNGNQWFANGQPLRFVHFSGNKIDDPNIFSRHSQQVTLESIGDLRHLLDYYREQVFSQGHQFYRKLPYAFSWDGEAGVNLHTPRSLDLAASESNSESVPLRRESTATIQQVKANNRMLARINVMRRALPLARRLSGGWLPLAKRAWGAYQRNGWGYVKAKVVELSGFQTLPALAPILKTSTVPGATIAATTRLNSPDNLSSAHGLLNKMRSYWKLARVASRMAGGWTALISKAVRILRQGGLATIRQRVNFVKSYAEVMLNPSMIETPSITTASLPAWMPRLLFIDWSTPRPDRDAGSLTAFHLMKIYVDLGYNVTFIPSDLQTLGEYTATIRELGVRCLHREDIGSISNHLQAEGEEYKFVLLCRAPIAALYIADIRKFAPNAKIILNTSDLHYLRDIREAELDGSEEKIEAAKAAKTWELNILRDCDVTIVMSQVEQEILKKELTNVNVDVRLIPLMFVETVYDCPPFEDRENILFIGGFPHLPNVDAVLYFCNEIFPLVRKASPNIQFHIIGNSPPPEILALANRPGVVVHGYIKDVSPIFQTCRLSVAPLRYGAGIKGKIGTSLAYGVPVVATSIAVEGMELDAGEHVLVADTPQQFADAIGHIYKSKDAWTRLSENGRDRMLQTYSPAAGHRRISALMRDINPQHKQIDLYSLRSFPEYDLLSRAIREDIRERASVERALIKHDQPNFYINGFCATCGCESMFNTSFMYSYETTEDGKPIPNWREHLDCVKCGFTNRIRAAMDMFYSRVRPSGDATIYITEQTTPLFGWLQERHPGITGSEYLGDVVPLGAMKDGLRNEDLTALTFPNNSFDHVLSFDVMEHVSDDIAALREVYRCLKPGGTFLFAAPFAKARKEKLVRARLLPDGSVEHIMPPEYHGNPVDQENGALCFRYFAWDLLDDMKAVGFKDPIVLHYWSRDFAYLGGEQFMFIGQRPV